MRGCASGNVYVVVVVFCKRAPFGGEERERERRAIMHLRGRKDPFLFLATLIKLGHANTTYARGCRGHITASIVRLKTAIPFFRTITETIDF